MNKIKCNTLADWFCGAVWCAEISTRRDTAVANKSVNTLWLFTPRSSSRGSPLHSSSMTTWNKIPRKSPTCRYLHTDRARCSLQRTTRCSAKPGSACHTYHNTSRYHMITYKTTSLLIICDEHYLSYDARNIASIDSRHWYCVCDPVEYNS